MTQHAQREVLHTDAAPKAIGPYSQAIRLRGASELVFLSGQIALDPVSGQIVGHDAATQAEQVLKNLVAVLASAELGPQHVVKTTIFLADMADFAAVNEVYGRVFATAPPARATVQAAGLPRGVRVEIDAIAAR